MRSLVPLVLVLSACSPSTSTGSPSPQSSATPVASASAVGLPLDVAADVRTARRWHLLPDGLQQDPATITADFATDPRAGAPRVRVANRDTSMSVTAGGPRGIVADATQPRPP
ncbi:MAG: hypothetical protein WEE03_06185, partial [Chloroflexota bacterium]